MMRLELYLTNLDLVGGDQLCQVDTGLEIPILLGETLVITKSFDHLFFDAAGRCEEVFTMLRYETGWNHDEFYFKVEEVQARHEQNHGFIRVIKARYQDSKAVRKIQTKRPTK